MSSQWIELPAETTTGSANVNIHDSSGGVLNSVGGSLDVNITNVVPISGITANQYIVNSVSAVAASATVSIINYTVSSTTLLLLSADATGTADGIYRVLINNTFVMEKRSAWTERSVFFELEGYKLVTGDNVKVNVTNNNLTSQDYNATIMGYFT